ncbi:MAG: RNA-binding S4 domain-containing protein [Proteobacteria bacterium]|nr:RNA-binding S4 domain-containing protein [Pseudomonadota bacterium]
MSEARIRIDRWLWHARFYKTRPLAQAAAEAGRVRLNGARVVKSGHGIKLGDVLTVPTGREALVVRVVAFGERRGPAPEARLLYEIVAGAGLDPEASPPV